MLWCVFVSLLVVVRAENQEEKKGNSVSCKFVVNLLSEGTEGVTEGFGSQMEQRLQEHIDLQGVESLPLI